MLLQLHHTNCGTTWNTPPPDKSNKSYQQDLERGPTKGFWRFHQKGIDFDIRSPKIQMIHYKAQIEWVIRVIAIVLIMFTIK